MPGKKYKQSRVGMPCLLTLVAGMIVTLFIFDYLCRMENDKLATSFQQRADVRVFTLQSGLDNVLRELKTINQFFSLAGDVSRAQFSALAAPLLADSSFIAMYSFQRRVKHDDLAHYSQKLRTAFPSSSLKEYSEQGIAPLKARSHYRIIDFVEPLAGNEKIMGMDVTTNPHDKDAHDKAILSGQSAVTAQFRLLQDMNGPMGVKLLLPVYAQDKPLSTPEQRARAYIGDAAVVIKASQSVAKIMKTSGVLDAPGINFTVYDGGSKNAAVIYRHVDPNNTHASRMPFPYSPWYDLQNKTTVPIQFADRTWRMELTQAPASVFEHHTGSFVALVLGCLFSLLGAVYVNTITSRARRVQAIVDDRTSQLKETNALLVLDNAARKKAEDRVNHMAQHDALTGLANRVLLQDRLRQAIARGARYKHQVWVVFLDLDRFKSINDSLGHTAGDDLLSAVSQRLRSVVRETDTVARFGGDEFVMIISEDTDAPLDKRCLSRVMDTITKPLLLHGHDVIISASVGVSVYPNDSCDPGTLIENADLAMYRAKELGRNNVQFYTKTLNEKLLEKLKMERALHDAISRDQFVLNYQPQVDVLTGEIVGAEALLRWRHPVHGLVPPCDFIGLAEDSGLIAPIGEWVLREACLMAKRWHDAGYTQLKMGVNVSARQFAHTDLVSIVKSVLEETQLDPACLDLELTESSIMSDVEKTILTLTELKKIGVKLSIDDFGTGYSSLAYLQRFPLDVLKIDQSFIQDIKRGDSEAAIVASVIGLSHNLKLQVIAEGVETVEQLTYLRLHGCDEVQGYYFSKPVLAGEFESLLRNGNAVLAAA